MRSVEKALAWLERQRQSGSTAWPGLCLSLVAHAYGYSASGVASYGHPTPSTWFKSGKLKTTNGTDAPAGALYVWTKDGAAGHIAISAGNGKVYTNWTDGSVKLVPIERIIGWGDFKGWAAPSFPAGNYQVARGYTGTASGVEAPEVTYNPNGSGPNWLAKFLYAKGLRGDVLKTAWAIAMRESGGKPRIDNEGMNSNGSIDYGLFQINSTHASNLREKFGWSLEDMRDPEKALKYFMYMSKKGQDLSAWNMGATPYDPGNSAYHTRLFQQQAAKFDKVAKHLGLDVNAPSTGDVASATGTPDGQDPLTRAELAESYGFAEDVIMSNKSLRTLFQNAVDGGWDETKFTLELKNTAWFKNRTPYQRDAWKAMKEGGKTWEVMLQNAQQVISKIATEIGAEIPDADMAKLAKRFYFQGWGEDGRESLLKEEIANYIGADGSLAGTAEDYGVRLRKLAEDSGVRRDDGWYTSAARSIAAGMSSVESWEEQIRRESASLFPVYSKQILAGQTAREAASPYIMRMADTLELDPTQIGLDDPSIRGALGQAGADGTAQSVGLWDFERSLRRDSRWQYTRQANEQAAELSQRVLKMFGFQG